MIELLPIIVLAAIAWFWWGATRAREVAVEAAITACQRRDVQFLDQTVMLQQMKLQRDERGQMHIARLYGFEFSCNGHQRETGYAVMLGTRLVRVHLNILVDSPADIPGTVH